jgi:Ser/Thr protein kinase RdoA (MazF antagonist)
VRRPPWIGDFFTVRRDSVERRSSIGESFTAAARMQTFCEGLAHCSLEPRASAHFREEPADASAARAARSTGIGPSGRAVRCRPVTEHASAHPLGELIAEGRTAQVYAFGVDRVVKVLRSGFPDALGEEEATAASLADEARIGAPRFHGLTRVDGRIGLIYERRDGSSMMEQLTAHPWRAGRLAGKLGSLHAAMHTQPAATLPGFRDAVADAITRAGSMAGTAARDAAMARLRQLPDGSQLCHGDFHPGNVLIGAQGPTVIDWLTAASGPPAADVGRTLLLLRDGRLPDDLPRGRRLRIGLLRRWFVDAYLRAYRRSRPLDLAEVTAWRLPLLVARLDEGIVTEQQHLERLIGREMRGSAGERANRVQK